MINKFNTSVNGQMVEFPVYNAIPSMVLYKIKNETGVNYSKELDEGKKLPLVVIEGIDSMIAVCDKIRILIKKYFSEELLKKYFSLNLYQLLQISIDDKFDKLSLLDEDVIEIKEKYSNFLEVLARSRYRSKDDDSFLEKLLELVDFFDNKLKQTDNNELLNKTIVEELWKVLLINENNDILDVKIAYFIIDKGYAKKIKIHDIEYKSNINDIKYLISLFIEKIRARLQDFFPNAIKQLDPYTKLKQHPILNPSLELVNKIKQDWLISLNQINKETFSDFISDENIKKMKTILNKIYDLGEGETVDRAKFCNRKSDIKIVTDVYNEEMELGNDFNKQIVLSLQIIKDVDSYLVTNLKELKEWIEGLHILQGQSEYFDAFVHSYTKPLVENIIPILEEWKRIHKQKNTLQKQIDKIEKKSEKLNHESKNSEDVSKKDEIQKEEKEEKIDDVMYYINGSEDKKKNPKKDNKKQISQIKKLKNISLKQRVYSINELALIKQLADILPNKNGPARDALTQSITHLKDLTVARKKLSESKESSGKIINLFGRSIYYAIEQYLRYLNLQKNENEKNQFKYHNLEKLFDPISSDFSKIPNIIKLFSSANLWFNYTHNKARQYQNLGLNPPELLKRLKDLTGNLNSSEKTEEMLKFLEESYKKAKSFFDESLSKSENSKTIMLKSATFQPEKRMDFKYLGTILEECKKSQSSLTLIKNHGIFDKLNQLEQELPILMDSFEDINKGNYSEELSPTVRTVFRGLNRSMELITQLTYELKTGRSYDGHNVIQIYQDIQWNKSPNEEFIETIETYFFELNKVVHYPFDFETIQSPMHELILSAECLRSPELYEKSKNEKNVKIKSNSIELPTSNINYLKIVNEVGVIWPKIAKLLTDHLMPEFTFAVNNFEIQKKTEDNE